MNLRDAYHAGLQVALRRHKIAAGTPAGATPGVMPTGDEMSHGTNLTPYAVRSRLTADVAEHQPQDQFNADWLWHNQDMSHMAPGGAGGGSNGGFGEEVIG